MANRSLPSNFRRNNPAIETACRQCGVIFETTPNRVAGGRGRFCSKVCSATNRSRRHGHAGKDWQSPTYNSWAGLIQRCTNPNHPKYALYGGRGIGFDPRWRNFETFLQDMGERPGGRTLDRIDNDGNYEPRNCRWATPRTQQNNQSRTIMVTYRGRRLALGDLAQALGLAKKTLAYRIEKGWPENDWACPPRHGHRH